MTLLGGLLGSSQREAWQRLCADIGAVYVPGKLLQRPRVRKRIDNWTVTLTASQSPGPTAGTKVTTTRLRAPFVSTDGFRFTIERKSAMGSSGKPIGRYYITSGYPDFDVDFWINSRDAMKARSLLDSEEYRRTLQAQSSLWLKVKDRGGWFGPKFPENVDLLIYECIDVKPMTDVKRLQSLFELMGTTLQQLCRVGSATRNDPGIVL
jgi:hypothetical protein